MPAVCRVAGVTEPAVNFEVWLPAEGWNGKFHVSGNGGMAGVVSYGAMAAAVRRGYAAASTDTGHVRPGTGGFDASWAIGRRDLVADFGHRSLHLTATHGRTVTSTFYERDPDYSYYVGCSKGGQQGLMEAQRYPDDFDGIVAGNPANDWTRFYAGAHLWYALATLGDSDRYFPPSKVPLLADAVNAACDALDGLEDGVLDDPRACDFDPGTLTCPAGRDDASCLTPGQVEAVRNIWAGSRNSAGEVVFPGLVPGGENGPGGGWQAWVTGREPFTSLHWLAADGFFKYMVFEEPDWNFRSFDYDADLEFALEKVGPSLDADSPDLDGLRDGGAKLIVYHGWSDPDISPLGSIDYYEDVLALEGVDRGREAALAAVRDYFRLFLVPGLGHCSGGPGYNRLDPAHRARAVGRGGHRARHDSGRAGRGRRGAADAAGLRLPGDRGCGTAPVIRTTRRASPAAERTDVPRVCWRRRLAWLPVLLVALGAACSGEEEEGDAGLGWRRYSAAGLEAMARGDLASAESMLSAAVEHAERHGPSDFRVAITLNILAGFYRTTGRHAEAEPLYERALAVAEERWGPDHPRVAMVLESYALLLGQTGRTGAAAQMAGRAAAIRRANPERADGRSSRP